MTATRTASGNVGNRISSRLDSLASGFQRHWLLFINLVLGAWVGLPWLAPVFMRWGWEGSARAIYALYSLFCHQFPQRSWFLFGDTFTPELTQIAGWSAATDPFALRAFIGTSEMGWKVAWSDRMVSFYGGWFLFGLVYALLRKYRRPVLPAGLRWRTALLFLLPMFVDGVTHAISDLWGLTGGFRYDNGWLAVMTGGAFSPDFYVGDAWGSFNSLARLITGTLAAAGLIFWLFPWLDRFFNGEAGSGN